MNKRGQVGEMFFILLIIAIIVGAVLLVSFIDNRSNEREKECSLDCIEYNATFIDYESPGYRNEECWCKRNKEPLRIW